ncbi:hypothetical protein Ddye_031200 [Dipteronia dyeriana]|uniref:Bet v I/Major latex protein domain-containing protein n=1 Tax=Dipteronia dyeriana TaxID=168575 RepID=A0AAD9WNG5_9ROSI|nr:hypothetical protein Ddye_031200 [Dipteronia dyeriana]
MAATGKLEVDVEIKSPADKFWGSIRDSTSLFPRAFPHDYKSIQVLEGDGKASGSVRLFTYAEGSPIVKKSTEKIEHVDDVNMKVSYSVIDGDLLEYYKVFKGFIAVIPKGDGSLVKWTCEFEKTSHEIPDPDAIKEFVVKNFKEVDDYILQA